MSNPVLPISKYSKENMVLQKYLVDKGWDIVSKLTIDSRSGKYFRYDDLGLSSETRQFLLATVPGGIYLHQKEALRSYLNGENICLSTGTGSGKSLVFYSAAIEELIRNPEATILAIYPLKALGKEQQERWVQALQKANLKVKVGRIDGQVPIGQRNRILKDSRILIATPDIIHAWLLRNIRESHVVKMVSKISLIIIDEIHNYTGVFGSNSAFLFRRLQHAMSLLGAWSRYITASATISNPEQHLKKLLGCEFKIFDSSLETSPKQEVTIKLINPPKTKDLLTVLSELMNFISQNTDHRFLCFVDSRKQTEYLTSITSRVQIEEEASDSVPFDHLTKLNVLPYRAGYEESDRTAIQNRLSAGTLKGVVSTSALELGIDIPLLTLGILVGVPHSLTSLQQRIGRIGRHAKGEILVINSGDVYSQSVFCEPQHLLNLPLPEGALYLENPRIQYISHGQLMREAYPGAVYYYTTRPHRVYRVRHQTRLVEVRTEKRYTTKPLQIPTLVFPNISPDNVYNSKAYGGLSVIECNLQIREALKGFKERRGPNEIIIEYPLDSSTGQFFDQQRFTRNYFTTGVILHHPIMNGAGVKTDIIASILFEAYLMTLPFERRDLNFASDKHRIEAEAITKGDKFVSIYDQTYGSLRLSGRVLEGDTMRRVLNKAVELVHNDNLQANQETVEALSQILAALDNKPAPINIAVDTGTISETDNLVKVILPGSKGINLKKGNEEFIVQGVFFRPIHGGLAYRGKHASQQSQRFGDIVVSVPINSIVPVPGESKYGLYNLELGELQEIE